MSESDAALARRLAGAAGELLLRLRGEGLTGAALGAAGDRAANALIVEALRRARPDDGLLSEETRDTPERLGKRRVWIVDPLDGTREYAEGRNDWAVHIAVAIDGRAVDGAVAVPALGKLYDSGGGGLADGVDRPFRMLVSRTRPPPEAETVAVALGAMLVPMGSAGAKTMAVVAGEADIYLHAGGQHEWDNCAPAAVAAAHGLHVSRLDGSPLVYNRADTLVPDLLICRRELAAAVFAALG